MSLKIKIGSAMDDGVTDAELSKKSGIKVRLDIRKTLGGNIVISDHPDIDIVVMPKENKVLALAKKLNSGVVYGAQDRLFEFLQSRGVISPESIQGGNIYASLEGKIPEAPDLPTIKIVVLNIAKWFEDEGPSVEFIEDYNQEVTDDYTNPDVVHSTELGQVSQATEKGSIKPGVVRAPYGLSLYNSYGY
jgi:hypothetical protein